MNETTAKGLGLGCVLALLFLALALVVIVGGFSVGMLPGRASPSGQSTSQAEGPAKTEPAVASAEPPAASDRRVRWRDIPEQWAVWPASGIPAGKYRGSISAPTLRALLEMLQLDPEASKQEFLDKLYGQWAMINSVDYLLAKACNLEANDDAL